MKFPAQQQHESSVRGTKMGQCHGVTIIVRDDAAKRPPMEFSQSRVLTALHIKVCEHLERCARACILMQSHHTSVD